MSPEQARGLETDPRTDIWSLGVVLYELLAGRSTFDGKTSSDVIAAILKTEPPPLAGSADDVPPELERIVTKALQKDREERYQDVKDLALDLKSLKRRLDVDAEVARHSGEHAELNVTPRARSVRRRAAILAAAAIAAAALAYAGYSRFSGDPKVRTSIRSPSYPSSMRAAMRTTSTCPTGSARRSSTTCPNWPT